MHEEENLIVMTVTVGQYGSSMIIDLDNNYMNEDEVEEFVDSGFALPAKSWQEAQKIQEAVRAEEKSLKGAKREVKRVNRAERNKKILAATRNKSKKVETEGE